MMSSIQQQNHGGMCGANDMCLSIFDDDDDGEIITVVDENKEEVDNSIAKKKKKISLMNKWKKNHRRSTASIIRTDHLSSGAMSTPLPTINESRNDLEEGSMIPDDIIRKIIYCIEAIYGL